MHADSIMVQLKLTSHWFFPSVPKQIELITGAASRCTSRVENLLKRISFKSIGIGYQCTLQSKFNVVNDMFTAI
jgi:hypothetical protein